MKKKITLCIEFRGGKGHAFINISPADNYPIMKQDFSACHDYHLDPDKTYFVSLDGVSPSGGSTVATLKVDGIEGTQKIEVKKAGPFSKYFKVTV
ncbi:MAG: hypothetical protein AB7G44_07245 [Bacteroidia bacterium]